MNLYLRPLGVCGEMEYFAILILLVVLFSAILRFLKIKNVILRIEIIGHND